jgi:hypothetical protein
MKKILSLGMLFLIAMVTLTACLEWEGPPGFDQQFHSDANSMFDEMDEDTAEGEASDRDDRGNFNRLKEKADTPEEQEYIAQMEKLLVEQDKIVKDINYSTSTYEGIRDEIGRILDVNVYEFEFTDGEDE